MLARHVPSKTPMGAGPQHALKNFDWVGGGGGGAQSNFPTREHQNILFNPYFKLHMYYDENMYYDGRYGNGVS